MRRLQRLLLDQRVLAGLGNVYKSEVAFAAGVNPFRAMRTILPREMKAMVDIAQRYMKANVVDATRSSKGRSPGTPDGKGDGIVTYAGSRRTTHAMDREERLWVYRRQGQELPSLRGDGDDAKAGSAGSVNVLVSLVSAMGWRR